MASDEIQTTLEERSKVRGDFKDQAFLSQVLKACFRKEPANWQKLNPSQREALDNIANKLARILTGDPNELDSWLDLEGYPRLIRNQLQKDGQL